MNTATDRSAPGHKLQRWSLLVASIGIALGVLAVLAVVLPGPAYRYGLIGLSTAFGAIRLGAMGGLAAGAISPVYGGAEIAAKQHRLGRAGT